MVNGEMNDVQIENPFDRLWVEHMEFDEQEEEDAPLLGSAHALYNTESDDNNDDHEEEEEEEEEEVEEEDVMVTSESEMATRMLPPASPPPPTGVAALRGLYAGSDGGADEYATDHSLNNQRV